MRSNKIEEYKKSLSLTQEQREIIVGKILGDGHLETMNGGKTYRLKIEQSAYQKDYVYWMYEIFKSWIHQEPKLKIKNKNDKQFFSYWFNTYASGQLRFYGQQFYPNGKKVIPKIIKKLLTPRVLAIWFMDDGSFKSIKHRTFIIHTIGYKKRELLFVVEVLKEKFGISASLHKQFGNRWRIYVNSGSASKFKEVIEPYVIPSLRYKLGYLDNNMPKE